MKLHAYCIYDSAAQAFNTPFFQQNDGLAIRAFQGLVNADDKNNVSEYPEQFTLFKIGEYDDQDGKIKGTDPVSLGVGITYKIPKESTVGSSGSNELLEIKDMLAKVVEIIVG